MLDESRSTYDDGSKLLGEARKVMEAIRGMLPDIWRQRASLKRETETETDVDFETEAESETEADSEEASEEASASTSNDDE